MMKSVRVCFNAKRHFIPLGLNGYSFHHEVVEKPNGNLLVTVNDLSKNTIEDVIIEFDRRTKRIVNTWDLNDVLDPARTTWDSSFADIVEDWVHANSVFFK